MSEAVVGDENTYFEMESKPVTEARVYQDLVFGESESPTWKQTTFDKSAMEEERRTSSGPINSCSTPDSMIVQRLLYVIVAVVVVSFLTAAATLILALKMTMLPNTLTHTSADCAVIQGMEKKIEDLTERLESTQRDLSILKSQPNGQIGTNSTPFCVNNLKDIWMIINSTAEKSSNLTSEVMNLGLKIEIVKRKSSLSSQLAERGLKKVQNLEKVLNATHEEVKMSRHHLAALWSGRNFTQRGLSRLWIALNGTQIRLEEKLMKLKDNFTAQEQQIKGLENTLNATREDAKNVSHQQSTALWLGRIATQKEFQSVWLAVNATQTGLEEKLMKLKDNFTTQAMKVQGLTERLKATVRELTSLKSDFDRLGKNATKVGVTELQNLWMAINSTADKASELTNKLSNISQMAGSIGPPGLNGSQGPPGRNGSNGPPGPKGSGTFSACQYKVVTESLPPGYSIATPGFNEPSGKRVFGVSCSTNYAAEYNLLSTTLPSNVRRYVCSCRGTSKLFSPFSGQQKSCYIHYWECPLTT